MIKIMFVCHGNICRSPMAEFILKDMLKKRGLEKRCRVASCATSTEEIWGGHGSPMYPPAKAMLSAHGIPYTEREAVQLRARDYGEYDLLIGMDSANIRNMMRMLGGDPQGKIRRLMDFTDRGGDVADPWYSRNFDAAYRDIRDGCEGILHWIEETEHFRLSEDRFGS